MTVELEADFSAAAMELRLQRNEENYCHLQSYTQITLQELECNTFSYKDERIYYSEIPPKNIPVRRKRTQDTRVGFRRQ